MVNTFSTKEGGWKNIIEDEKKISRRVDNLLLEKKCWYSLFKEQFASEMLVIKNELIQSEKESYEIENPGDYLLVLHEIKDEINSLWTCCFLENVPNLISSVCVDYSDKVDLEKIRLYVTLCFVEKTLETNYKYVAFKFLNEAERLASISKKYLLKRKITNFAYLELSI